MSNPQLFNIEPGGENTQYESAHIFTEPPAKQTGQLGVGQKHTESEMKTILESNGNDRNKKDEDMDMARRLETGEPGGILGETDKGIV